MFYTIRSPWWLRKIYPHLIWRMPPRPGTLYLTFDDGPHPTATPFVLDQLRRHNARATFFCIGKNVQQYPQIYRQILMEGHRVGNHTYDHLNGWKVADKKYLGNIGSAATLIDSDLFRPPYGRISWFQSALLRSAPLNYKIVMWDVLSADFDQRLTAGQCVKNVIGNARPGSIIVFHDSAKAFDRLQTALPLVLEHFAGQGHRFESIFPEA
jgi:peptidoglycan/xylan/chitin deacetylase (PgdA/CDA1 family)